jgi:hypothetical protein
MRDRFDSIIPLNLIDIFFSLNVDVTMKKERIITILILIGLFGGPIASLLDYHASPVRRFWLSIIPEFIGFTCTGIMVYYGRSRKE